MATSLKIDDELKGRVRQLAERRQRSPHWIMREAIKQYVDREEARESFRQEAEAGWATYRETGLHLTGEEVRRWLRTWGTEDEPEMPECHEWSSPKVVPGVSGDAGNSCSKEALRPPPGPPRPSNATCCRWK